MRALSLSYEYVFVVHHGPDHTQDTSSSVCVSSPFFLFLLPSLSPHPICQSPLPYFPFPLCFICPFVLFMLWISPRETIQFISLNFIVSGYTFLIYKSKLMFLSVRVVLYSIQYHIFFMIHLLMNAQATSISRDIMTCGCNHWHGCNCVIIVCNFLEGSSLGNRIFKLGF